jgi:hypothetical protein
VGWKKVPYDSVGICAKKATEAKIIVLKQLLNYIPRGILNRAAEKAEVVSKSPHLQRCVSYVQAMFVDQLYHAVSLNDVCHLLRVKTAALSHLHIKPPPRNTLSHPNKVQSADFIETLFWSVLEHLQSIKPWSEITAKAYSIRSGSPSRLAHLSSSG